MEKKKPIILNDGLRDRFFEVRWLTQKDNNTLFSELLELYIKTHKEDLTNEFNRRLDLIEKGEK